MRDSKRQTGHAHNAVLTSLVRNNSPPDVKATFVVDLEARRVAKTGGMSAWLLGAPRNRPLRTRNTQTRR
eukprot:1515610-Lingulodinium_polyedra.AAC.1